MFLSPLGGWWVLVLVGVVGLLLCGAAAYVLMQPTKSAVTFPPRMLAPMPAPMPAHAMQGWSVPPTQPMTAPPFLARPPFKSPDATLPLAALTGDMLDNALIRLAPRLDIARPQQSPVSTAPMAPPAAASRATKPTSKAPLPLRPNATLVSATPPPMPKRPAAMRTLPPPASRVPALPFALAAMPAAKAAEALALSLDSDLPPAMSAPDAADTERSIEDDEGPTMMTAWDSMAARRGSA